MNLILLSAAVIIGAVLLTAMLMLVMKKDTKREIVIGTRGRRTSAVSDTDQSDGRTVPQERKNETCGICFGVISEGDAVARCECGQAFHDTCAEPTGACPYCAKPYDDLEKEIPERVMCPVCGVVINHDGTLVCKCGNIVAADENVCKACGAEYDCKDRMHV